jgi:hypothetical protein
MSPRAGWRFSARQPPWTAGEIAWNADETKLAIQMLDETIRIWGPERKISRVLRGTTVRENDFQGVVEGDHSPDMRCAGRPTALC